MWLKQRDTSLLTSDLVDLDPFINIEKPQFPNIHAHYPLDDRTCTSESALHVPMHPALSNFLDLTQHNLEQEAEFKHDYTKANHDYGNRLNPQKLVQIQACLYNTLFQWRQFAAAHNMTNWAACGGSAVTAKCFGAMNYWDDDIDITLDDCTTLDELWQKGKDVAQVYPHIRKEEYHREASNQVFEGRLVTPNLILLKGSICCHWFKLKTISQCESRLRPEPEDISGIDIECMRPAHLATTLKAEPEAKVASGWQDYDFSQGGIDDVMFGPTKMQLMPEPILSKYILARYGKRDACSYPFASGQDEPISKSPRDDSLPEEQKYLPTIREYSMDYAMEMWYTSKAKRESWLRQAGNKRQQELTQEFPNLDRVEIDNEISKTGCHINNRTLKVVGFNAKRGANWMKFANLMESEHPDVLILNGMDIGMARSGNAHTTRRLAHALKMNYAFGVEYVELTRGTKEEQEATAGKRNALGLHGNAILTKCFIGNDAIIIRDPIDSDDFSSESDEIRLGGRMGLFARIKDGESHYIVGSVHKLAETKRNQASIQKYISKPVKGLLGTTVQGGFPRTLCQWIGLQNVDNPKHFTFPASCGTKPDFGNRREDNICASMQVVGEDQVIAPCYESEMISDHGIVSVLLQAK